MKQLLSNPLRSVILVMLATLSLHAETVGALVVSKDVDVKSMPRDELASIFLGKKSNWDDGKRINIGYAVNAKEKVAIFFNEFIGQNHRRFKKYWLKKVFAGYGTAPKLFKTPQKALEYVNNHEGCILFLAVENMSELEGFKQVAVDGLLEF